MNVCVLSADRVCSVGADSEAAECVSPPGVGLIDVLSRQTDAFTASAPLAFTSLSVLN